MPSFPRLRRRSEPAKAVTAAATRIDLTQPARSRKQGGQRQPWQEQLWGYYDVVPELKTSVLLHGTLVAKARLVMVTFPSPGAPPVLVSDPTSGIAPEVAALAEADLARLRGDLGGQQEILREGDMNVVVAGECFLVGWGRIEPTVGPLGQLLEGRDESWEIRSISEVEIKGSAGSTEYWVKDGPGDKGRQLDAGEGGTDTIIRIWQRHPRWSQLADCALNGVRGECEALVTLHAELLADSRSRHNAGVVTLPNELSFGSPPDDGDDTGDDAEADEFIEEWTETFTDPRDDPLEPGAVAPAPLRGPAEFLDPKYLRWMDMGRKPSAELDNRIKARVERLARGLPLPVESVMGHQQTTFANAGQVDEDEFTDWIAPSIELLCDAFTVGYSRPNLVALGMDPAVVERIHVWYDPAGLIRDPDMTVAANDAYDRNEVSAEGYRQLRGIPEDMAPDPHEVLIRAGLRRGILTADLTLALLNLLGETIDVAPIPKAPSEAPMTDAAAALMAGASDDTTSPVADLLARHPEFTMSLLASRVDRAEAITATARPRRSVVPGLGRRLMSLDMDLRSRLLVLADRTMDRALERAGNRLRSQQQFRGLVASVPAREIGAHLGPALVASAGLTSDDLLADSMATMRAQFMEWGARAQQDAIEQVSRAVGGFTAERRGELQLRQADSLEEAWAWLEQALVGRAEQLLYDPSATAVEALGEVPEGISVAPGMIREAMAVAGGGAPVATSGSDAFVTISAEQYRGGIGTGSLVNEVLGSMGYGTEGYEWVYGPGGRSRPFEPHVELDGLTFVDFADEQLAVTGSFPDGAYYIPGDHAGCLCDVAPVIVAPDGSTEIDA